MFPKKVHSQIEARFTQDEARERSTQEVDERLSAYYGPALPSHSLSEAAWLRLRDQLEMPGLSRFRPSLPSRQAMPVELLHGYAALLLQTNYRHPAPALRCRFTTRRVPPRVRSGGLGRGSIKLVLPRENWQTLQKAELDLLLAAGLARHSGSVRLLVLLPRALFAACLLVLLTALPFASGDRRALWIFLAALVSCLIGGRLLIWQQRILAFRADRQAVQWLGREHVCRGLHLLAERGQPGRRGLWGEPSLCERIARICGSPVSHKDKRLTLVS
jgi:hypothetical protein